MKLHIEFCIFTVEYNFMYLPITKNAKSMSELRMKGNYLYTLLYYSCLLPTFSLSSPLIF